MRVLRMYVRALRVYQNQYLEISLLGIKLLNVKSGKFAGKIVKLNSLPYHV